MAGLLCVAMGVIGLLIPSVMNIEAGRPETATKEISEAIEAIEAT